MTPSSKLGELLVGLRRHPVNDVAIVHVAVGLGVLGGVDPSRR